MWNRKPVQINIIMGFLVCFQRADAGIITRFLSWNRAQFPINFNWFSRICARIDQLIDVKISFSVELLDTSGKRIAERRINYQPTHRCFCIAQCNCKVWDHTYLTILNLKYGATENGQVCLENPHLCATWNSKKAVLKPLQYKKWCLSYCTDALSYSCHVV